MKTPAMRAWMKSVPKGKCPGCRKPLPTNRITGELLVVCRKRTCWRQYFAAYRLDHARPNVRRKVVARKTLRGSDSVSFTLDCQHLLIVPKAVAAVPRRTRVCPVCKAKRTRAARKSSEPSASFSV